MTDQYRLNVLSKQHQISFPVARLAPLMDIGRAPIDSHTSLDAIYQAAAFASTPTALAFATRQVVSPAIVLGATDLRIDKPIDRFIADDRTSVLSLQSASDLGRRPALSQPLQDLGLKRRLTKQSASPPATAFSLLFSIDRLIAHFSATVAFEFTRYSRWRAIHSCRDFADCFPGLAIPGNRATLFQRKLFIFLSHRNTLYKKCCTSFVNLGILAALHARERTGEGQKVVVSMQEAVLGFMISSMHEYFTGNSVGNSPSEVADGYFTFRMPDLSDAVWARLRHLMDRDGLIEDPRFATAA